MQGARAQSRRSPKDQAARVGGRREGVGEERQREAESGVLSLSVEDFPGVWRALELPADSQRRRSVSDAGE